MALAIQGGGWLKGQTDEKLNFAGWERERERERERKLHFVGFFFKCKSMVLLNHVWWNRLRPKACVYVWEYGRGMEGVGEDVMYRDTPTNKAGLKD